MGVLPGVGGDVEQDGNPTTASRASSQSSVIGAPHGGTATNPGSWFSAGSAASSTHVPAGSAVTSPVLFPARLGAAGAGSGASIASTASSMSLFTPASACGGVAAGVVAPPSLRQPTQFSAMLGLYYPGDVPTLIGDTPRSKGGGAGAAGERGWVYMYVRFGWVQSSRCLYSRVAEVTWVHHPPPCLLLQRILWTTLVAPMAWPLQPGCAARKGTHPLLRLSPALTQAAMSRRLGFRHPWPRHSWGQAPQPQAAACISENTATGPWFPGEPFSTV